MKIGITGHTGRLGGELWKMGCEPLMCDIRIPKSVYQAVSTVKPDVIIHCAALTNVDYCETNQKEAKCINVDGTRNLRMGYNGKIIHISTDYIFDGKRGPYSEHAIANPISVYGQTKYNAERVISRGRADGMFPDDVIVRTTILYGNIEKNDFVSTILKNLSLYRDIPVKVTKSVSGNPTYIPHLAEALINIAERDTRFAPVINVAGRDTLTRYEFALMIAHVFNCDKEMVKYTTKVSGIAPRPRKAGLKTKYAEGMEIPIYSAHEGLEDLYCALEYV